MINNLTHAAGDSACFVGQVNDNGTSPQIKVIYSHSLMNCLDVEADPSSKDIAYILG